MQRKDVEEFFRRLAAALPAPKTELEYANPYTLLVAVVLSAQATDVGVNKATKPLFAVADTAQKMLALGEERLTGHIKSIGLYRIKARNVIKLSALLVEQHGGKVPRERAALEALPGVGRKTASVVLNVAFGERTIAVDTHIFPRPRQDTARRRTRPREARARALCAARPPLAHPARPLRLQGAQAGLPVLPRQRPLSLQGEDDPRVKTGRRHPVLSGPRARQRVAFYPRARPRSLAGRTTGCDPPIAAAARN